mmetsp:Transcript_4903/g.12658  ORF Transcript_4903/g.12658 Transcript_4903/m.12658 type:complete len:398 (+) Transcript_4903:2534-3727(+)
MSNVMVATVAATVLKEAASSSAVRLRELVVAVMSISPLAPSTKNLRGGSGSVHSSTNVTLRDVPAGSDAMRALVTLMGAMRYVSPVAHLVRLWKATSVSPSGTYCPTTVTSSCGSGFASSQLEPLCPVPVQSHVKTLSKGTASTGTPLAHPSPLGPLSSLSTSAGSAWNSHCSTSTGSRPLSSSASSAKAAVYAAVGATKSEPVTVLISMSPSGIGSVVFSCCSLKVIEPWAFEKKRLLAASASVVLAAGPLKRYVAPMAIRSGRSAPDTSVPFRVKVNSTADRARAATPATEYVQLYATTGAAAGPLSSTAKISTVKAEPTAASGWNTRTDPLAMSTKKKESMMDVPLVSTRGTTRCENRTRLKSAKPENTRRSASSRARPPSATMTLSNRGSVCT